MENNKKTDNESFETLIKELDKVIQEMEHGSIDQLDKLIENYEYGSELIEKCNKMLKNAELRVNKITQKIQKETRDENV